MNILTVASVTRAPPRTVSWMATASGSSRRYVGIGKHTRVNPRELMSRHLQKEEAHKFWNHPTSVADISKLFAEFCLGKVPALPWSDTPPSSETTVISTQLARLNEMGFLTINSQPAVDGVRSDDKVHGWGPSNGFVYQKVCTGDHILRSVC